MRRRVWTDAQGRSRVALYWKSGAGQWQKINLHQAGAEIPPHAEVAVPGTADLCFLVDHDSISEHLTECDVAVESGPVERSGATGPLSSVYVRDPDGNLIELANDPGNRWEYLEEWDV